MRSIVSIVGKSNSGKTDLLEKLIDELQQRGYQVAVIKHAGEEMEFDKVGKDSSRLADVTQGLVMVSTSRSVITIRPVSHDLSPQELARFIGNDVDLILAEGFKESHTFKIEVLREGDSDILSPPKELLAIVTRKPVDIDVPQYSRQQIKELVDLMVERLSPQLDQDDLELVVNGEFIKMNPFVRNVFTGTLLGFLGELKEVVEVKDFRVYFRKKASI
jgi:molybdopterin-guanine dinucleotide biosynthesis protein B